MMKKIMIVEDSNLMIAVIKKFVLSELPETEVLEAHSGEESVEKYKLEKPDLVFMDIMMPGMDGMMALENIRKYDPNAKVVMCTSLKEPDQEERAKELGCVGYIMKPFSKKEIIEAVAKHA